MTREKSETKSCEQCKYFEEMPQILSLGEPQGYFRFCGIGGLHEPIDDSWELDHEICFVKKENNQ